MDGISKMPFIFSRIVRYWKAFSKCLSFPQMNRKGSQRNHPTTTIGSILEGQNAYYTDKAYFVPTRTETHTVRTRHALSQPEPKTISYGQDMPCSNSNRTKRLNSQLAPLYYLPLKPPHNPPTCPSKFP